jgi:hypothetical protein
LRGVFRRIEPVSELDDSVPYLTGCDVADEAILGREQVGDDVVEQGHSEAEVNGLSGPGTAESHGQNQAMEPT